MGATLAGELFCQFAQAGEAVCSELAEDARQHLRQLLVLSVAGDGEGVGREGCLHFGVIEVDHGAVVLDHIHLEVEREGRWWVNTGFVYSDLRLPAISR